MGAAVSVTCSVADAVGVGAGGRLCLCLLCSLVPNVDAIALDWPSTEQYNPHHERLVDHPTVGRVLARQQKEAQNQENGLQLSDCFDAFTRAEVLGDDERWKCKRCKAPRRGLKTMALWALPDILVIHLKRFYYSRFFQKKLTAFVNFPLEGLDLEPWCASLGLAGARQGNNVYDLFAVVNHSGNLGGGTIDYKSLRCDVLCCSLRLCCCCSRSNLVGRGDPSRSRSLHGILPQRSACTPPREVVVFQR